MYSDVVSKRFCSSAPGDRSENSTDDSGVGEATANFGSSKAVQFLKGCFTGDENVGMFQQSDAQGHSQLVLSFDIGENTYKSLKL